MRPRADSGVSVRVFNQMGPKAAARIAAVDPTLEVVDLSWAAPAPDLEAEVVFGAMRANDGAMDAIARCGVRWVHVAATGVDDLPESLFRPGITLTCARAVSAIPIAEFVVAAILAFEKQIPEVWVHEPMEPTAFALGELGDKTVAIVGFGGIGVATAERLLPFGTRVRAMRRTDAPSPVAGVELVGSLDELLPGADHVVVAAPLTPRTRHLLDARAFSRMKRGVHVVNVARGGLIDHEALRFALDDRTVARASLDVTVPEPPPAGHWLYSHRRVRVSPHASWSSPHLVERNTDVFVAELARYLRGEPLRTLVDPEERY